MSDETTDPTPPAEPTEPTDKKADAPKGPSRVAPPSILSRPSDPAARPGFRSPPNQKSKAQKKKK